MRRDAERNVVAFAVVVGLGLTGLTVWAVARQGRALRAREWADLRNTAAQAAAEKTARLRSDVERTFTAAAVAWQMGKVEGLGWWLEGRRPWSQAVLRTVDGTWTTFPRNATQKPPPAVTGAIGAGDTSAAAPEEDELRFAAVRADDGGSLVVAIRRLAPTVPLGLIAPATDLIREYWPPRGDADWRVATPAESGVGERLCSLGPAFGNAELVPSEQAAAHLAQQSRRQATLLAITAVGSAGAWGIVIWLMRRALARQRELVRLQGRFVADVSHELKTPLTMIRLLAETLQDGRVRDADRIRTYYETITREAERLSVLLDGILDFARIESGRAQPELVDCDVADVARQAWALFEPQLAAEGFERRIEIAADLPPIQADAAALQQVFVNLLQNAYRYAGDGKFVRMTVSRDGYVIVITVEDHGIGMTRAQLTRLGDSFFRAEETRVRQTRGTGLGLAIVSRIVRAHGGKLEAQSRPGQGSTFTVWIPFEPTQADVERGGSPPAQNAR